MNEMYLKRSIQDICQDICSHTGNLCSSNIRIDPKKCTRPCEGIYADVSKMEAKNISGVHFEDLIRDYNNYKRFFDLSTSN